MRALWVGGLALLVVLLAPGALAGLAYDGPSRVETRPGEGAALVFQVVNEPEGVGDREYHVTISSNWTVEPEEFEVVIGQNETRTFTITATAPANASTGGEETVTVVAYSCPSPNPMGWICSADEQGEGALSFTVRVIGGSNGTDDQGTLVNQSSEANQTAGNATGSTGNQTPSRPVPTGEGANDTGAPEADPPERGGEGPETGLVAPVGPNGPLLLGAVAALGLVVGGAAWAIRRRGPTPAADGAPSDRYQQREVLGRGSFGTAVLARDRVLDRPVVLKTLHMPDPEPVLREARAAGAVEHRNILQVYDAHETPKGWRLVMEYAPGGSLEERLAAGPLAPPEALRMADEILGGLAAVHDAGIVHRDLKPANVLVGADGRPRIGDFGMASAPRVAQTLAASQGPLSGGTLLYLAPEQLRSGGATPASDLYAVGAILYEMLDGGWHLGSVPRDPLGVLEALRTRKQRLPLDGISQELNRVLATALARDPKDRFPDARAFRSALSQTPEGRG